MTFDFDLSKPNSRFTRDQILNEIRRWAASAERPLSAVAYQASRPYISVDTVRRHFRTFEAACLEAGVEAGIMKRDYSDEELIDAFEKICADKADRGLNAVPVITDFKAYRERHNDGPSHDVFVRRFGPFKEFKKRYEKYHLGLKSRSQLIQESKASIRNNRIPISAGLRAKVFHRDGSRCVTCGRHASDLLEGECLHVDHKVTVAQGGDNSLDNLQTKCSPCNLGKGNHFCD